MSQPVFHFVRRGYDPGEVEQLVQQLQANLEQARQETAGQTVQVTKLSTLLDEQEAEIARLRAELQQTQEAPGKQEPVSYASLGERIAQMLTLAREEADGLLAEARAQADKAAVDATAKAEKLTDDASRSADEVTSKAQADATKTVADAKRQADYLIDQAGQEARARREEAEAFYENQRAIAAQAAADFERTLAERRDRSTADFTRQMAQQEQTLKAAQEALIAARTEAEQLKQSAQDESEQLRKEAHTEADNLLRTAKDRAEGIRQNSERELAAAVSRRDAITAQLSNVRQMLGTLGGVGGHGVAAGAGGDVADQAGQADAWVTAGQPEDGSPEPAADADLSGETSEADDETRVAVGEQAPAQA